MRWTVTEEGLQVSFWLPRAHWRTQESTPCCTQAPHKHYKGSKRITERKCKVSSLMSQELISRSPLGLSCRRNVPCDHLHCNQAGLPVYWASVLLAAVVWFGAFLFPFIFYLYSLLRWVVSVTHIVDGLMSSQRTTCSWIPPLQFCKSRGPNSSGQAYMESVLSHWAILQVLSFLVLGMV